MQSLVPIGGQGPEDPAFALPQSGIGGFEVEDHGDAPTCALELPMLVGSYGIETHDAGVKTIGTVWIFLEDVRDLVGETPFHGLPGRGAMSPTAIIRLRL